MAATGLVAGAVAGLAVPGSPPPFVNAILFLVLGGLIGYQVFASEGPRQRPASALQAAIADGIVATILTFLTGAVIDVVGATGAGSSSTGPLSRGGAVLVFVLAIVLGGLAGAGVGALAFATGGRARFERPSLRRRGGSQARLAGSGNSPRRGARRKKPRR